MRVLGETGMRVSSLCLGTMMFGPMGNPDKDACVRIIHRALDAGINFIDTADVYSRGVSEDIVGEALKGRRENVVLATKFWNVMGDDPNQRGGSRRWIVKAVEDSLRRLGVDYIDLYQMHRFDVSTSMDEVLFTLTELVRQGKIRNFGSSMFPADRIVEAQWTADRRGPMIDDVTAGCSMVKATAICARVTPAASASLASSPTSSSLRRTAPWCGSKPPWNIFENRAMRLSSVKSSG